MEPIRMVDLKSQYQAIKSEIDTAIQDVIDQTAFVKGPRVKEFANQLAKYLDVPHVIPCGNGTDALQVALMASGLQHGDEVITSNFTFIATVEAIALLGLRPVLVDVDPRTYLMPPEKVEEAITAKTKAILPVHLFGQCTDMQAMMDIAGRHGLIVIEDAAQSLGTECLIGKDNWRKAGTIGHIGCTSFFPSKNLGCYGDGGALFTRDELLAEELSAIVNHGMKKRYYHDRVGVNSRLDGIQAAILQVKLQYLDKYNKARQEAAAYYDGHLKDVREILLPERVGYSTHIFHQYTITVEQGKRDQLKEYLHEQNIPAMVYYPVPLHEQKAYQYLGFKDDYPVTNDLCKKVISLPMHTELTNDQLGYIAGHIQEFFNQ